MQKLINTYESLYSPDQLISICERAFSEGQTIKAFIKDGTVCVEVYAEEQNDNYIISGPGKL